MSDIHLVAVVGPMFKAVGLSPSLPHATYLAAPLSHPSACLPPLLPLFRLLARFGIKFALTQIVAYSYIETRALASQIEV